jgi:hypothetical protein
LCKFCGDQSRLLTLESFVGEGRSDVAGVFVEIILILIAIFFFARRRTAKNSEDLTIVTRT